VVHAHLRACVIAIWTYEQLPIDSTPCKVTAKDVNSTKVIN
jgi:hypothetical protein